MVIKGICKIRQEILQRNWRTGEGLEKIQGGNLRHRGSDTEGAYIEHTQIVVGIIFMWCMFFVVIGFG